MRKLLRKTIPILFVISMLFIVTVDTYSLEKEVDEGSSVQEVMDGLQEECEDEIIKTAEVKRTNVIEDAETKPEEIIEEAEILPEEIVEEAETLPEEIIEEAETLPEEIVEDAETLPEETIEEAEILPEEIVEEAEALPEEIAEEAETLPEEAIVEEMPEMEKEDIESKNLDPFLAPALLGAVRGIAPMSTDYPDTIAVTKTALRSPGCRTYEVTLGITGTPPEGKPVDVVLVIDTSGSMEGARMTATKIAAKAFNTAVLGGGNPNNNRISIVEYSTNANHVQNWTNDKTTIDTKITGLSASGYTNIHQGFIFAEARIDAARPEATKVIVMMSDGGANRWMDGNTTRNTTNTPTSHNASTNAAWQKGQALWTKANVFTVGLFDGMPNNQKTIAAQTLEWSAQTGQFFDAPSPAEMEGIYTTIANLINYSAKDAIVVDEIGADFDVVEPLPAGGIYDPVARTVTWKPGTIIDGKEYKYQIVAKPSFAGGPADTNVKAELTYTDVNDVNNVKKLFPVPNVNVPANLSITLTDVTISSGDSIQLGIGTDASGPNYMSPVMGGDNNGSFTYEWRKLGSSTVISTDKNPSVSPTEDTEYELTVIDSNGCIAVETMMVTVKQFTEFTATKVWQGGSTLTRPEVKFELYRNIEGEEATLYRAAEVLSGTTHTWSNLELTDEDGNLYIYSFKELDVENYTPTYSEDGSKVTNTYKSPTTGTFTANKVWDGGPVNDRPVVKFQLYRNIAGGTPIAYRGEEVLSGLSHTWNNLELTDEEGNAYIYSFKEIAIPNYTSTYDGNTVTNTYKSPTTGTYTAKKVWDGGPVNDRPEVKFQLYRNIAGGTPVTHRGEEVLSGLTHTWSNLELTDQNGNAYIYSFKELAIPNYTPSYDGNTVTNTYKSPTTGTYTAKKVWDGGPVNDRPIVKFQLYRNIAGGTPVTHRGEEVLSGLTHTWSNLELTDQNGNAYIYSFKEIAIPNYTPSYDGNTVTNTYKSPETGTFTAKKVWVGGSALDRPEVKFQLYRNITGGTPVTHRGEEVLSGLTHTWNNLELTDQNGNDYIYSFKELDVANYETSYDGNTVTNTYKSPTTGTFTAKKVWVGGSALDRPEVKFQLYRNIAGGTPVTHRGEEVLSGLTHTWSNLELTDEEGNDYIYSFKELVVTNYTQEMSADGLTVTNTYKSPTTGTFTANKVWEGGPVNDRPEVKFQLYRNIAGGTPVAYRGEETLVDLTHTWSNLELTDEEGNDYIYSFKEIAINNYTTTYSRDGLTVTNTYVSPKINVTGYKVWTGGPEDARPDIELQLYRNGIALAGETVTLTGGVTFYEWVDLDKTDSNGVDYVYAIDEVEVPDNYVKTALPALTLTVTNTYTLGSLEITKVDGTTGAIITTGAEFDLLDSNGNIIQHGITAVDGKFTFEDLLVGSYTLVETKAPTYTDSEGNTKAYRLLASPIEIEISRTGQAVAISVENFEAGWELPPTGGHGPVVYFSLGSLFMMSSIVMYIKKKRSSDLTK